ncbi:hypothetical protein ACRALDRAFT_1068327, partial [Sodiomyces alcalophilus JCM 7366]|uniref:uncharacterized protein n=1 Tax=Sodiomyces alcalophilus JCM 7366 TaxID=591952 RepID=UPI0039B5CB28
TSLRNVTNFNLLSTVNKGRKPKFELHLKIYDLNNVPLVSGSSFVKWHLSYSIHADHRGRTPKSPIVNHKVEYNYSTIAGHIRIGIDKNNVLSECPIEFEVLQEFPTGGIGGGRDERISLGVVKLNLSEYVDECEVRPRELAPRLSRESNGSSIRSHFRKNSAGAATIATNATNASPSASVSSRPTSSSGLPAAFDGLDVEDGIVRRYLMQDSKINSTLKIGIFMVQVDGDRNFAAPPLKTAPVFGGIAGIMAGEQVEQDDAGRKFPPVSLPQQPLNPFGFSHSNTLRPELPTLAKSRDQAEIHDMYRKSLAASWSRHPGELSADECIENIFAGGDGWPIDAPSSFDPSPSQLPRRQPSHASDRSTGSSGPNDHRFRPKRTLNLDASADASDDDSISANMGGDTLRPGDYRKFMGRQLARASGHGHGHTHGHTHGTSASTTRAASPSRRHRRHGSNTSDKSINTVTGRDLDFSNYSLANQRHHLHLQQYGPPGSPYSFRSPNPSPSGRESRNSSRSRRRRADGPADSRDDLLGPARSPSESMTSLAPTLGSDSSDGPPAGGYRRMRELGEFDVRDDMVAWSLPGEVR